MVFHVISVVATRFTVPAFIESTALPRSTMALLIFGRRLMLYLPRAPLQWLGSYSIYLEEMLSVLVIVLAHTTFEAQSKRQARVGDLGTALTALLKLLVQPVNAVAGKIHELRHWRHHGPSDYRSTLAMNKLQGPIADPHIALSELLRAVEASGGFIAVQQGSCFAVVASVNAVPVGHRLELAERAAAGHLRVLGMGERTEHAVHQEELAGKPEAYPDPEFERMVERAVKGLSDYSVLGQSALVGRLRLESVSQIQQAKVLRGMLVDAIESLRPAGAPPSGVLPRQWHAYTILREAYIDDVPNRDIMSKLYISEGTFNRQRRKAMHAVATAIWQTTKPDAPRCFDREYP